MVPTATSLRRLAKIIFGHSSLAARRRRTKCPKLAARQPLQLAISFNVIQFPHPESYKIDILLDDHEYTNNISINVSDKPIS